MHKGREESLESVCCGDNGDTCRRDSWWDRIQYRTHSFKSTVFNYSVYSSCPSRAGGAYFGHYDSVQQLEGTITGSVHSRGRTGRFAADRTSWWIYTDAHRVFPV